MTAAEMRAWRERLGLTRADAAAALRVSAEWIRSVEMGRRQVSWAVELACGAIEAQRANVCRIVPGWSRLPVIYEPSPKCNVDLAMIMLGYDREIWLPAMRGIVVLISRSAAVALVEAVGGDLRILADGDGRIIDTVQTA